MAPLEQGERQRREEFEIVAEGVRAQMYNLEEKLDFWRRSMMSAFTLLAQRDASDYEARKSRQAKLDHELRLLRWGLAIALFLLVVLLSLFVGYRLK